MTYRSSALLLLLPIVAWSQDLTIEHLPQANGPFLVEGCTEIPDTLLISRPTADERQVFTVQLSGTATLGIDYTLSTAGELVFEAGIATIAITLAAVADNVTEGPESILISMLDAQGATVGSYSLLVYDDFTLTLDQEEYMVCQGEFLTVGANPPGDYVWSVGDDQLSGSSITIQAREDRQEIIVNGSFGSCSSEARALIRLRAGITFDSGDTAFVCLGETANVSVSIVGDGTGAFVWSPLDTAISVIGDRQIRVLTSQTRTYYLRYTTAECEVLDSVVIRVDSLPELPITVIPERETYCPDEKVTLFTRYLFPPDFPDVKYKWTFTAGTPISADTLQNFVFSTMDTSYYTLTTTNNACMRRDSVLLYVLDPPVDLSLTDTTVCPDQPVRVVLLNADDFDELQWSPEMGISCTDCPNPTIRVSVSTQFTVTGMSMGCPASGTINVNIFPPELIRVMPDTTVCPGSPVRLFATNIADFEDLTWNGSGLQCNNCDSPVAVAGNTSSTFQVTGTKDDGCVGIGGGVLGVYPLPSLNVTADPPGPVELGTSVELNAFTSPDLSVDGSFSWTRNDQPVGEMQAQTNANVLSEGDNVFKVSIITPEGCMIMSQTNVIGNPPRFDIPSAFSPTGDMINDRFKVLIFGNIRLAELKVFNRWGQIVFDGTDANGWDGRHNGEQAPPDVYAYQAVLELPDGSIRTVRGDVTLMRR